ncbi:MAG: hypothetical protein HQL14_01075 [Candidatus Omnitrophica bacterium]|nr:hypothetical protein [Candidatus Omnitrophota bacterium]
MSAAHLSPLDQCTQTGSSPNQNFVGNNCTCGPLGGCNLATDYPLYAGTYNNSNYMTTPSGCTAQTNPVTGYFYPSCSGGADPTAPKWSDNAHAPSSCNTTVGNTPCNVTTGASSQTDGRSNTNILASYADTDPALYCHYMVFGGYSDWYLPAASMNSDANGELKNVLYFNSTNCSAGCQTPHPLTGFTNFYWSSTESSPTQDRFVSYVNGNQVSVTKTTSIGATRIRCVRRY